MKESSSFQFNFENHFINQQFGWWSDAQFLSEVSVLKEPKLSDGLFRKTRRMGFSKSCFLEIFHCVCWWFSSGAQVWVNYTKIFTLKESSWAETWIFHFLLPNIIIYFLSLFSCKTFYSIHLFYFYLNTDRMGLVFSTFPMKGRLEISL